MVVVVSLTRFPPRTEPLLSLLDLMARSGVDCVVIDWGGMFPWSVVGGCDGRDRLHEQEVAAVEACLTERGVELVPSFPLFEADSRLVDRKRLPQICVDEAGEIDLLSPGTVKLALDMLEDMVTLLPSTKRTYVPFPKTLAPAEQEVWETFSREAAELGRQIVTGGEIAGRRMVDPGSGEYGLEAVMDRILSREGAEPDAQRASRRARELRKEIIAVESEENEVWHALRRAWQWSIDAFRHGCTDRYGARRLSQALNDLEAAVRRLCRRLDEGGLSAHVRERWFYEYRMKIVAPLEEGRDIVTTKLRQVKELYGEF